MTYLYDPSHKKPFNTKGFRQYTKPNSKKLSIPMEHKTKDKLMEKTKLEFNPLLGTQLRAKRELKFKGQTAIQDRYNSSKTWLIKKSKCRHYSLNQSIDGKTFYSAYTRQSIKHINSICYLDL